MSRRGRTVTLEEWQEFADRMSERGFSPGRLDLARRCRRPRSPPGGGNDRSCDQPRSHQRPHPTEGWSSDLPRKEVIQPHLPVRLPCYDFVPITDPTFDGCLLAVGPPASGVASFHDVTGGVYKPREHIHRRMLTGGY